MREQFNIFLLAGQSNMAGRGDMDDVEPIRNPNILMFRDGEWMEAEEPLHTDKPDIAGAGLGMSFAASMIERYPEARVGLIPAAVGGTPLERWMPGAYLYERAMSMTRDALGDYCSLQGILWHQGEADSGLQHRANTYGGRFSRMIESMRSELNAEGAPVVAGELGRFLANYGGVDYFEMVNQALRDCVGRIPLYGAASSEGLSDKGDLLHFDANSLRLFGRRYAEVYCEIVGD